MGKEPEDILLSEIPSTEQQILHDLIGQTKEGNFIDAKSRIWSLAAEERVEKGRE